MDIGVINTDSQITDLIIKSNIVREMPIYNNLVRAALLDRMEDRTMTKAFRDKMRQEILK